MLNLALQINIEVVVKAIKVKQFHIVINVKPIKEIDYPNIQPEFNCYIISNTLSLYETIRKYSELIKELNSKP